MNQFLEIHPEVKNALAEGKPVVALESTIISHGMPYPQNLETAIQVEEIVRSNGAVPATIAIFDGKCHAGLDKKQLGHFASEKDVWKVSLRDIPYVISKKLYGATTVAATMRIASMVGIKIFVTGGIGGVHRNANETMDISADLTEMEQTSVAVVSAGIKSILDIGHLLVQWNFCSGGCRRRGHPIAKEARTDRRVDSAGDFRSAFARFGRAGGDHRHNQPRIVNAGK